jgi:hypothetical protein
MDDGCDAFVLPSQTWKSPVPAAVIEKAKGEKKKKKKKVQLNERRASHLTPVTHARTDRR